MYIAFDYLCPHCKHKETKLVERVSMDKQLCPNCVNYRNMTRLPAGTRTTFRHADTKLKK